MRRAKGDSESVCVVLPVLYLSPENTTAVTAEYEELQQVASSNQRRDDRLAKVRGKDFSVKLEQMEVNTREGRGRESTCCLVHRMSVCSRGRRWRKGRRGYR